MSKNKIIIGIVVLVLLVGGWVLFRDGGEDVGGALGPGQEEPKFTDPRSDEIAVEGKLDCLPLKSGAEPEGDECVIGLVGSDGKHYALDTSKVEVIEKGIGAETVVRLVGKYSAADTGSAEAGNFRYDGVLSVRVMQNQSN